jgi:cell wall-associated NlpC family hydrolase
MESRVRYADGEPAKIVAISTALHDGHPVVAVGTLGVVTRHTLTGSYSERQETTRPWDLVLDEGGVADIKLQKQVGHLQDLLRSERKYHAVKKEELERITANAVHVSNDLRAKLADEAHKVDEYRGKFAEVTNALQNEKNHSAFLKIEIGGLKAQITQTVKELDEDPEKCIDTGALIKELRQNLFDQKTQTIAANGTIADLQKEYQIMQTALTHRDAEQAKLTEAASFDKATNEHIRKVLQLERDKRVDIQKELVKVKETNTILASEVVALEKQLSEADTRSKNQREAYEKLVNELRFDIAKAEVWRVKLQHEIEDFQKVLMEVRSENTLLEEKLNSFAPPNPANHFDTSAFFGYVFKAAKEVSEQNDRTEH